ncbi:hypothetical protein GLYMA_11G044750v4 [Glycine max]|nr:hypothetical protein GLYMA_11G044750v4 [Glycine max]KAH1157580.1 hypothetical protein GYH30_030015 [Glycine max]
MRSWQSFFFFFFLFFWLELGKSDGMVQNMHSFCCAVYHS